MEDEKLAQITNPGPGANPLTGNPGGGRLQSPSLPKNEGGGAKSLAGSGPVDWAKGRREFANFVHLYIRDFIKFADQKAAFVFAAASAIIAFLVKREAHKALLVPISTRGMSDWFASLSFLFVALSGVLSLYVVLPRLRNKGKGLIYWKGITSLGGSAKYIADVEELSDEGLTRSVFEHCYELAEIADHKYEVLKWAMWLGAMGGIAAGYVLLGL